MNPTLTYAIADDHPLIREAFINQIKKMCRMHYLLPKQQMAKNY